MNNIIINIDFFLQISQFEFKYGLNDDCFEIYVLNDQDGFQDSP